MPRHPAHPKDRSARFAVVIALGVIASVVAALALAPIMTVGWCATAPLSGASMCHTEQLSILGAHAPWWLWLTVQLGIVVATVLVARARAHPRA